MSGSGAARNGDGAGDGKGNEIRRGGNDAPRGGNGVGSASIVLIFAVLCMTVFALISLSSAVSEKALADVQERLVKAYYQADTRAEYILAEILEGGTAADGVVIVFDRDQDGKETACFSCPMSEGKELYVEIDIYEDSYYIQKWQIRDTRAWEIDDRLPVWQGD